MKNKNLFLKIYIPFLVICIAALITLSILGKKARVGYLGDFKFDEYHINHTLELNGLTDIEDNYIIDGKLDEESLKNFIFTNDAITNYSYGFRLQYYNKVFRNSDIYEVYIDTNKILQDNPFIKKVIMDGNGSPFGGLISSKVIEEKIDNVNYILKLKTNLFFIVFYIFLFILLFNIIIIYDIQIIKPSNENIQCIKNISKENYLFISLIVTSGIILFIFHFWLSFPGYFQFTDIFTSMLEAFHNNYSNLHPIIIAFTIHILYKIFGYNSYYILLINLLLFYSGIILLTLSVYIKSNNKFSILILLISFMPNLFFINMNHVKDVTASLFIWFAYSILFFIISVNIKSKYVKFLFFISIISIIIGMLWRHNFIVTVYPIFLFISFYIIKDTKLENRFLINLFFMMLIFAIILIGIIKIFPSFFNSKNWENVSNHIVLLQIAGCAVPADDGSMIPNSWYLEGKTFEDVKKIYMDNKLNADSINAPWAEDKPFKGWVKMDNLYLVWLKYIFKYPLNYIKHVLNFAKNIFLMEDYTNRWKWSEKDIQNKVYYEWVGLEFYDLLNNKSVIFTPFKEKLYSILYNILPDIHIIFFILISIILFFISIIFIIFIPKFRTYLLIFTFSVSFSSVSTIIIVVLFTPIIDYRYIHPIVPISIISFISFVSFIKDIGGLNAVFKELKLGKKK